MDIKTMQRTALDRYLRTVRMPLDKAVDLFDRDGGNSGAGAVRLTLDRADATVRDVAGRIWRDDELRAEATRRRVAADERERALRLEAAAEERSAEADAEFRRRQEQAEQRRFKAEQQAEDKRRQAEEKRQADKRRAAEQAARTKAAVRKSAAKVETAIDKQAREARLGQLEEEAAVLQKQEAAIVTEDEAQRLRKAASQAKAARKQAR